MKNKLYKDKFYKNRNSGTSMSASIIISIIKNNIDKNIKSVIDLGCGVGTFLSASKNIFNTTNLYGIEGDYVNKDYLVMDSKIIHSYDLEKRYKSNKKYDLAISLEVAEHLSPKRADSFVEDLTNLSDIILFSAAVPKQTGVGHINEQPHSYWIKKFKKKDYILYDIVRPKIWSKRKIPYWYRNNVFIFVKNNSVKVKKSNIISKLIFYTFGLLYIKVNTIYINNKYNKKDDLN